MKWILLFLIVYGVLALSHILIQMFLAHLEHRKQKGKKFFNYNSGHFPTVSVVVPSFNEDPELLDKCLKSILDQKYEHKIETFVIDDGSSNLSELKSVYDKYSKAGMHIILNDQNIGKRASQKKAFDLAKTEIVVTVDSDTVIESQYGVMYIVRQFKNEKVGAVTGDVKVINKNDNLLTRLISYRYWTAFHQERAAQSLFSVLMCCSGPFSAYRKSVLDIIKNDYVNQDFLGKKCTYGDDRHLTNLVLEEGHLVQFDNKAIAFTNVPDTLGKYIKQQIRWNKSFYREILWTFKFAHKRHAYMAYDLILQSVLPFLLVIALAAMAYQSIFVDIHNFYKYILILIGIATLRALYGIFRTRDLGFLLFIVYGFIHILFLIPVRFYALGTLRSTKWGTR
jgi:hyaluronan synthase/N-acetylglucosaminyltransferase